MIPSSMHILSISKRDFARVTRFFNSYVYISIAFSLIILQSWSKKARPSHGLANFRIGNTDAYKPPIFDKISIKPMYLILNMRSV